MSVSVDQDFARFGSKSYAINKINSVEVRTRQPHGLAGALIFGILTLLCGIAWFNSFGSEDGASVGTLVFVLIFGLLAFWQWQQSKIREYQLFVMTSSSEAQAFMSRDQDEVVSLRDQIESAMLHHSRAGTDR